MEYGVAFYLLLGNSTLLFLLVGPTRHPVADFFQQLAVPKAGRKEVQSFSHPHNNQQQQQ